MKTLADILTHGNNAEASGAPVVQNWPQIRGAILLIGRGIDLDTISIDAAVDILPEHHGDLPENVQGHVIAPDSYHAARRELLRFLATQGAVHDPWEAMRAFTRKAGRDDIENMLYHLRAPARIDGLVPAQLTMEWFNLLDQAAGVGQRRASLRAGLTSFNKLFGIPEVVASGLLPPEPLGPFLSYDRLGRPLHGLPPTLRRVQQASKAKGAIDSMWQAMCVSGCFDLPSDPTVDYFREASVSQKIEGLSGALIGVGDKTMNIYRQHLRRGLELADRAGPAANDRDA